MKYPWKIYCGDTFIDSGFVESKDERDGISKVLTLPLKKIDKNRCYVITVGSLTTTSYGDEFMLTDSVVRSGGIELKNLLESTFGSAMAKRLELILVGKGYGITDIRDVDYDQASRTHTIWGDFRDQDGCLKGWSYMLSDLDVLRMRT